MNALSPNWFSEGLIDLEYKQYVLRAYLHEVRQAFGQTKLYPVLSDLIAHYRILKEYQDAKQALSDRFPQRLTHFDAANLQVVYASEVQDDDTMQEIDAIVAFSLPVIENEVEEGRCLYDQVNDGLSVAQVGLMPLYRQEGYFFLRRVDERDTHVYQYGVSFITSGSERYGGINTEYVTTFRYDIGYTYEQMKTDLILSKPELPNPATYVLESQMHVPLEETLTPVARRKLLGALVRHQ